MEIYRLYLTATNKTFYIGKSNDVVRRLKEHKRASGNEDKYKAIRAFDLAGIKWDLEVIAEETNDQDEDWYVYSYIIAGAPLTNMKAGDVYKDAELLGNKQYATASDYTAALVAAKKAQKKRHFEESGRKIAKCPRFDINDRFKGDLGSSKAPEVISPGLARLRAKKNNK